MWRSAGTRVAVRALSHALASTSAAMSAAGSFTLASDARAAYWRAARVKVSPATPHPSFAAARGFTESVVSRRSVQDAPWNGFADVQGDDMAFVNVDMSMVNTTSGIGMGRMGRRYRTTASSRGPSSSHADNTFDASADAHEDDMGFVEVDLERVRHYRVEVTTASLRGAGTSGRAEITLVGDKGSSPAMPLEYEVGNSPGFKGGTTLPFRLTTYGCMGKLKEVQMRLIPEMSQVGHGWLLEGVVVKCEQTGDVSHFHSHRWFGESDCGGKDGPLHQVMSLVDVGEARARLSAAASKWAERAVTHMDVSAAAATVPHVDKTKEGLRAVMQREWGYGGEDAYFVKKIKRNLTDAEGNGQDAVHLAFGVADGVYMWRNIGVDAGLYSRRLMGLASEVFASDDGKNLESHDDVVHPEQLLAMAFEGVTDEKIKGSTTACIATIDAAHGVIHSANVGDSGFMIVRGAPGEREVCHRSPHQEHEFGRPFQLGHHDNSDSPSDAMLTTFPLEAGDIIVVGSDGLWDNLSESEILEVVNGVFKERMEKAQPQPLMNKATRELVSAAYAASMDKRRTTPYSLAATEAFDMVYSGGKKDDITAVIVSIG